MSIQRSDSLDQLVGEQWVELSSDEKKKICDALIAHNQPNVMQEFASLVRFTRGYLHDQPTGPLLVPEGTPSAPVAPTASSQPSDDGAEERMNDEGPVDAPNPPRKKARTAGAAAAAAAQRNASSKRKAPVKLEAPVKFEAVFKRERNYVKEEDEADDSL